MLNRKFMTKVADVQVSTLPHAFDLPGAFAHTGIYVHLANDVVPTQFQVLGERGSGTNYLSKLVARNIAMKETDVLGWKHALIHSAAIPSDFLAICVFRDARSWARSMHSRPWHGHSRLQRLSFSDFIRHPWEAIIDRTSHFKELSPELHVQGEILQFDRDPLTGLPFENLFALRRTKLAGLLGIANRGANVAYVRFEAMLADPGAFIDTLREAIKGEPKFKARKLGLRMPPDRRMGNRFRPNVPNRPPTPETLSDHDLAFLQAELDLDMEARLGYDYNGPAPGSSYA